MQTQRPLAVVTPTLDGDVLTLLALADVPFTTGQLQRMLGDRHLPERSLPGIRRTLHRLVRQGTVTMHETGTSPTYQLNGEHLAASAVRELAQLRSVLLRRLTTEVERWSATPVYGALFGSAARGQMTEESDIDLLLIRSDDVDPDGWETQVQQLAADVRRWTGNPAEVLQFTQSQVREHQIDAVLHAVAQDGLTFIGPPTWLRRAVHQSRHG
jgi:predicted nucleotidyltransferase